MYKNSGFTLIELLLVIALMSISVGITGDILLTLIRSYNKSQVMNEVEQNANFVAQKLEKELRNGEVIISLDPGDITPLQSGDSFTEVKFRDRADNEIRYQVTGGIIYRQINAGANLPLTTNVAPMGVTATCISGTSCFTLLSTSPQVIQVGINLTQAGSPGNVIFEGDIKIESVVVIRETY